MRKSLSSLALGAFAAVCMLLVGACNCAPTLRYIGVSPKTATINAGGTQQYTAIGYYSNGTQKDMTSSVVWTSSSTSVATVSAGGAALGVAAGTTTITAYSGSISGTASLTVINTVPVSIVVTPANKTVGLGQTQQFTAIATYADESTKDVTALCAWSSEVTSVATITSPGGLASALSQGTTSITCLYLALSASTNLTVGPPVPVALQISPANPTAGVGSTVPFTAVTLYSDGSTQPATGTLTWTSGTLATATFINSTGLASALAAGTSVITVTNGTLSGTTTLTVNAAAARFAYSANINDFSISSYLVNTTNGTFVPTGKIAAQQPQQAIVHPSGRFLYSIWGNGTVSGFGIYNIDPVTGLLSASAATAPGFGTGGFNKGAIDPTGRLLFVVDNGSNTVAEFTINQTDGSLTAVSGSPFATGSAPLDVLIDHTGTYVYTMNNGAGNVSGFSINPGTFALTALPGSPYAASLAPGFGAIDGANQHVYVTSSGSNAVDAYTIQGTGALVAVSGSPFAIATSTSIIAVAVDPSSSYIYVLDSPPSPANGQVFGFKLSSGGLGAAVTGSPYATGSVPLSVTFDPSGKVVAATNNFSNTVSLFSFASSTGVLTPTSTTETGAAPQYATFGIGAAAPSITPSALFTANASSNDLSGFSVNGSTGVPTAAAGSPVMGVAGNATLGTDLLGKLVETVSPTGKQLASFTNTIASNPPLAAVGSPVNLTGTPSSVVVSPSANYVYVADTANGQIDSYAYNAGANTITSIAGATGLTNLHALAMDKQATVLYALAMNTITPFLPSSTDGSLHAQTAVTVTGNWTAGAVDPSGRYFVALDPTAKALRVFSITPVSGVFGSSDGELTAVGSAVPTGGTLPASVTFDPQGRFLVVTDGTAGTVTPFTFNGTTGALTAGTAVTLGSGANQAAFDAAGNYLFVTEYGNPSGMPVVPGSVAVYSVAANGALTAVSGSPFAAGTGTKGVAVGNKIQ